MSERKAELERKSKETEITASLNIDGTGTGGLNLGGGASTAAISELTGGGTNSANIYGDLLTPGRPGEMLDFLKVSPDGKYVAVVRDQSIRDSSSFSF